jgi:chromosome segregation ATPase
VGDNMTKANIEMTKHADAVTKLGDEYGKLRDTANTDLAELKDQFVEKMKSISDAIQQTTEDIQNLQDSYNQNRTDETASVGDKIVASEQNIADIKKKLQAATTDSERQSLQDWFGFWCGSGTAEPEHEQPEPQ